MMAAKKSGLGRGLDALFPEKSVASKSGVKDTKEKTAVHPEKTAEKKRKKRGRSSDCKNFKGRTQSRTAA